MLFFKSVDDSESREEVDWVDENVILFYFLNIGIPL